jgi:hypothetical protein
VARAGRPPCARVLAIAERHLEDLEQRISQLSELRNDLRRAVTRWRDGGIPTNCASTLCGLINEAGDPVSHQTSSPARIAPLVRRRASGR